MQHFHCCNSLSFNTSMNHYITTETTILQLITHTVSRKSWTEGTSLITTTTPQPFYGPFSGPPGWAGARRELLDFMVQGKINRGRHPDHPGGRHSIRTNQCPPPPSPHITHVSFGQGSSLLWTHTLRPFIAGLSSLSGIYSAPLLGVAYCLA